MVPAAFCKSLSNRTIFAKAFRTFFRNRPDARSATARCSPPRISVKRFSSPHLIGSFGSLMTWTVVKYLRSAIGTARSTGTTVSAAAGRPQVRLFKAVIAASTLASCCIALRCGAPSSSLSRGRHTLASVAWIRLYFRWTGHHLRWGDGDGGERQAQTYVKIRLPFMCPSAFADLQPNLPRS